jgi:hypothetical protein
VAHPLFQLFAVSAITMVVAHTVARERICEPMRRRLGGKDTWLGYLVSCPYCASHWVAFVLVALTGLRPVPVAVRWGVVSDVLEWFLASLLVVALTAFLRVGFYFVDETQGLVRRRIRREEVETRREEVEVRRVEDGGRGPPPAPH